MASPLGLLLRSAFVVLVPAALFAACDDDSGGENNSAAGSSGAGTAGQSSGGSSSGGSSSNGKGGSGKGGGGGGGGQSKGGTDAGGQGNAGEGTAPAAGAGGIDGSGGEQSSGGGGGSSEGGAGGAGPGPGIDCFEGLRAPVGSFQDGEKVSADTSYRMRLALETGDRFGTSGSVPWLPIRLELETPEGSLCVTDEALLAAGYAGTHHNCDDVLTFTQGGREYTITNPDSAIDYVDPTTWMRPSMLTISEGGDTIAGPIRLDTIQCTSPDDPEGACRSGGPC